MHKNFLSKKKWHTGSFRNIEKTWLAEQKVLEEEKKLAQLRREREEERKIMELKVIIFIFGMFKKRLSNSMQSFKTI